MHSLLKIIKGCISLCDKDVLNDMVTLETITKGNKEKRLVLPPKDSAWWLAAK